MNATRLEVLEVFAEETRPRTVEKREASFDPRLQPRNGRAKAEPIERFMSYVKKGEGEDACWIFTGGARFHLSGKKMTSAAIFAWEYIHGQKPGRRIHRQCGNGRCIRHLGLKRPPLIGDSRHMMHTITKEQERKRTANVLPTATPLVSTAPLGKSLAEIVTILDGLSEDARSRILGALAFLYPSSR